VDATGQDHDEVEQLRARVADLERARADDVERLNRAEAALANTQHELLTAQRRVADTERALAEALAAAEAPHGEPARDPFEARRSSAREASPTTSEPPPAPPPRSFTTPERTARPDAEALVESLRSHISVVRAQLDAYRDAEPGDEREHPGEDAGTLEEPPSAERPSDASEDPPAEGASLRERLASAANARHRQSPPTTRT